MNIFLILMLLAVAIFCLFFGWNEKFSSRAYANWRSIYPRWYGGAWSYFWFKMQWRMLGVLCLCFAAVTAIFSIVPQPPQCLKTTGFILCFIVTGGVLLKGLLDRKNEDGNIKKSIENVTPISTTALLRGHVIIIAGFILFMASMAILALIFRQG
jgi:hypothetical protein